MNNDFFYRMTKPQWLTNLELKDKSDTIEEKTTVFTENKLDPSFNEVEGEIIHVDNLIR